MTSPESESSGLVVDCSNALKQTSRAFVFFLRQARGVEFEGLCFVEFRDRKQRTCADALQQVCLLWFQFHEQSQHVQEVDEVGGVLGQPVVGLDFFEL